MLIENLEFSTLKIKIKTITFKTVVLICRTKNFSDDDDGGGGGGGGGSSNSSLRINNNVNNLSVFCKSYHGCWFLFV